MTSSQQKIHFEKGTPYVGQGTSQPCDMSKPEFSGLKEAIQQDNLQSVTGDYTWDQQQRRLQPVS